MVKSSGLGTWAAVTDSQQQWLKPRPHLHSLGQQLGTTQPTWGLFPASRAELGFHTRGSGRGAFPSPDSHMALQQGSSTCKPSSHFCPRLPRLHRNPRQSKPLEFHLQKPLGLTPGGGGLADLRSGVPAAKASSAPGRATPLGRSPELQLDFGSSLFLPWLFLPLWPLPPSTLPPSISRDIPIPSHLGEPSAQGADARRRPRPFLHQAPLLSQAPGRIQGRADLKKVEARFTPQPTRLCPCPGHLH